MALALKAIAQIKHTNALELLAKVTPSGNYTTGGDALDLTAITDPNAIGAIPPSRVPDIPVGVKICNCAGYYAQVVPNAALASYKLQFFESEDVEVAQAGYPAAISGGEIVLSVFTSI